MTIRSIPNQTRTLCPLALAFVITAACGGGGAPDDSAASAAITSYPAADLAAGKDLYNRTCAMCHGFSGEGVPRLGKPVAGTEFVASRSDEELVRFLIEGRAGDHPDNDQGIPMPPRGGNPRLTDEDLGKIVAYVRGMG